MHIGNYLCRISRKSEKRRHRTGGIEEWAAKKIFPKALFSRTDEELHYQVVGTGEAQADNKVKQKEKKRICVSEIQAQTEFCPSIPERGQSRIFIPGYGNTIQLIATIIPATTTNPSVVWSMNDESVYGISTASKSWYNDK